MIDPAVFAGAEIVLPSPDFDATLQFFTQTLGFTVDMISPADDPARATINAHGLTIRLDRDFEGSPATLRLLSDQKAGTTMTAPNGTKIDFVAATPTIEMPDLVPSFTISRLNDDAEFGVGRAGMRYRDLVPDRHGGRFIASHIHIPVGGPVPDYVHYHHIHFQMIYCYRGWVKVVYEDQGDPFVLLAGDCVVQPPQIRHRVLEASDNLQVIEIGSPATHDTFADRSMPLPTGRTLPDRDYGGQQFVRHQVAQAMWEPWHIDGFECRDLGIRHATKDVARVEVARPLTAMSSGTYRHTGEFALLFILDGDVSVSLDGAPVERLHTGDSVTVPPSCNLEISDASSDLEILEVALPG